MNPNHASTHVLSRVLLLAGALALATASGCAERSDHQVSRVNSYADEPHVALDGSGRGLAIWTESDDPPAIFGGGTDGGSIVLAHYDAATGFAAPSDYFTLHRCTSPRVGMHADGTGRVAWVANAGTNGSPVWLLYGGNVSTGGSSRVLQEPGPNEEPLSLSLATNRRGDALLAWWSGAQVFVSIASPGGAFGDPIAIAVTDEPDDIPVVVATLGPNGDGVVVRSDFTAGTRGVFAHHFRLGFDPLVPVAIDDGLQCELGGHVRRLAATVDYDGFVTAAWIATAASSASGTTAFAVNRFDPTTGWEGATTLSSPDHDVEDVLLGCDLSGAVRAQWSAFGDCLRSTYTSAAGWSQPAVVGTNVEWSALAVAPNGNAIASGTLFSIFDEECVADLRLPTGWSGLQGVNEAGDSQDVAIEESGLAIQVSVVEVEDPFSQIPQTVVIASVWQAPAVTINPPSNPAPGVPSTLDARATLIRSTDAEVTLCEWDFESDGVIDQSFTDSTGLIVTHTFPSADTYYVRLYVEDSWGHGATGTVTVVVHDGGGGDGPPWRLLAQMTGGTGVVDSDDDDDGNGIPDIHCPSDCEELYGDGELVFLRATPDPGFQLDRWDGLDSSKGDMDYGVEGCLVRMNEHRTITAVFEPVPQ